jgi:peptidoglycan hydrolase-like protein with peptidoglycan-binding domain
MATATVGRSDIEKVVRKILNEERTEKERATMRAIRRVSSLLTEQIIPNLPGNAEAGEETGSRELTATRKVELAAQRKVAPVAGKPLRGVRVPGVNLQRGAQGAAVKQLQSALVQTRVMTQAQMNTGPGSFGPQTQASLRKFQRAHGVEAIGVYGPKTRAAFVRLGAKVAPKPPSGHQNPFLAQFQRALVRLRLPKSWASSQALWQLIQHESSWNPRAKNLSSTAFGLFQFLKSTWTSYCREAPYGSPDPYIQALGGFRYLKARYGTPEGAWAFWNSHHWW